MALKTEEHEQFKICGLCSQLVDESVLINASLKSFLLELLNVTESSLPEKTCLECYKSAIECRRFKEACQKSISKLEQKKVSDAMILGKSKSPVSPAKKTAPQPSKKNKILESLGLDPEQTEIDVKGGRHSRSAPNTIATPTPAVDVPKKSRGRPPGFSPKKTSAEGDKTKQKCRVIIKKLDRKRADRQLEQLSISEVQKIIGKSTQTPKRGRPSTDLTATPTDTGPPAKRGRKAAPEPTPPKSSIKQTPEAPTRDKKAQNKSNSTATPTGASRSSFGRVRSTPNKSGYVYGDDMNDSAEPIDVEPTPPPPSAATKKGQQLPKAKKGPKPKPVVEEEVVEVEPEDEDMEEVFPTIGPYQCEICQIITDTKVEFVEHIEGKHSDVVDEEVLLSLKSDIRKSKKKNGASEAPPPPPPKKPSPKKAAPTPPPKKATPAPPPKKAVPTPPPKKATPAPPPKKAAAPPPQPKKAVGRPPAPDKAPTPSPKPEVKKGPASKTQTKPMGPASKTQSKPMGPASKTKPGPKPKSQPAPQAVVAGSVKSPAKEKFHSWLCDICDTMVPRSSPSEIARHKNTKSCQTALKRKKVAENKVDVVDDPLGGLEAVPTYGASAPVVVMDNAEEDILEPQDQEDDNSDDHSGAANGNNGKPMVEIQNGHRERQKERVPPKPILNFWDDTPAEEYASQFDKVVVEPVQRRDSAPIDFPF